MKKTLIVTSCVLVGLGITFLITDCACGNSKYYECSVIGHHYVPAHDEVTSSTDSQGRVTIDTTHYSEEFHIICVENQGDGRDFDCSSRRAQYYSLTNGQQVTVVVRVGKWTKVNWVPRVYN